MARRIYRSSRVTRTGDSCIYDLADPGRCKLGDIKIQSTEQSTHVVPMALSASGLLLGLVLIGAGVYTRRDAQRV